MDPLFLLYDTVELSLAKPGSITTFWSQIWTSHLEMDLGHTMCPLHIIIRHRIIPGHIAHACCFCDIVGCLTKGYLEEFQKWYGHRSSWCWKNFPLCSVEQQVWLDYKVRFLVIPIQWLKKERKSLFSDFAKFENFLISTFVLDHFTSLYLHWYSNWFQSNNTFWCANPNLLEQE